MKLNLNLRKNPTLKNERKYTSMEKVRKETNTQTRFNKQITIEKREKER